MKSKQPINSEIKNVTVKTLPIKLGQFLKICNCVQDGIEAKIRILNGEVEVNGEIDTRRGRQLKAGDTVLYEGVTYQVVEILNQSSTE